MQVRAFAPKRDFSEPDLEIEEEEIIDDRLGPEEVAQLLDTAAAAARKEGHAAGFQEGQEAERETITAAIEGQVEIIRTAVETLQEQEKELLADLENRTSRLLLALVHQLAKRLSEPEAKRLAENVAMRAIEAVRGQHMVTIRATPEFLEHLRAVLRLPTDEDAAAHRIAFEAKTDATDEPLEVAWLTGKVTFDPYAFTGAIDDVFTETLQRLTDGEGTPSEVERTDD
ncbi:MAG: hypothetical protein AAF788_01620 [Pseudomonadota bacterium]